MIEVNGKRVTPADLIVVVPPEGVKPKTIPGFELLSSWTDGAGNVTRRYRRINRA